MNPHYRAPGSFCIGRRCIARLAGCVTLVIVSTLAISDIMAQDNAIPRVSGVSLSTAPASGDTYQRGDPIEIRIDFDRLVAITGTPQINLTVGTNTRAVALSSTGGPLASASFLFFEYTVVEEDRDTDGVSVAANAILLNGGGIKSAADGTTDADLTHAALTAGSGHQVDGSRNEVPRVTGVSFVGSPANGNTYELGETIDVKVEFDRFIEWSVRPQVELTIGGQIALAGWDHGSGTGGGITKLYFDHEVQANDFDADGISIAANAIRLNGGTLTAASDASLDADLTHAALADDATRRVDGAQTAGPAVTSVRFFLTPANGGAYQSGESIRLQVWFDRSVTVNGEPSVELTVGGLTRQATVRANSARVGVQGLGFEYVVQANDQDADGISIAANAIRLNGGTITATDGTTAAVLTHPAVPDDPSRKVGDGTTEPPTTTSLGVSSIYFRSSPTNGDTYQRGETIDVRVLFTGRVLAGGSPRLALTIGNQTRVAQYYGNHFGRTLSFRYTVQAADSDSDGISIAANALSLNGGSIAAHDGSADAGLTHVAVAADSGHKVNGSQVTAPSVSGVAISSRPRGGTTYVLGESIVVEVRFSEPVTVTGSPRLALTVGSATRGAGFVRSSDRTLWFRYRVQDQDRDDNGIGIAAGALSLNGGTIRDRLRNAAQLGLGRNAIANAAGHLVDADLRDTTPPAVSGVAVSSTPQKGTTYVLGETIAIEVRFSESVTVTGAPRLAVTVGSALRTAVYAASRLQIVRFHYVVAAGDRGALSVAAGALSLNGGTILDAADNAAALGLGIAAGALGAAVDGVREDEDPPTVRSVEFESTSPSGDTYEHGDIVQVAVRFSEPVTVTGQPQLALAVGTAIRRAGLFSAEAEYVRFRYTVQEEDNDPDGVEVAAEGVTLNGGAIVDAAGNAANLSLTAVSIAAGEAVFGGAAKETVPTRAAVTSEPSSGDTYGRGDSVDVEVQFNKEVTVSGRPVLELTIGSAPSAAAATRGGDLAGARAHVTGSKRTATLVSGGNERLHFRYVVQSSDGSPGARVIIASDALRLSGGSLIDARGERLDRANLSLDTAQVVHGDLVDGSRSEPAAARLVAVVSEPQADRTYRLGEHLLVEVQFDKGITVTGTPQLELAIDGTGTAARRARFVSTDHDTIRFRYDVQAADRDDDGIEIAAGALHLNGGSIRAAGGGSVELGLERAQIIIPADKVDGSTTESTPPVVASVAVVSPAPGGSYGSGDRVSVEVSFSEPVVVTGRPQLELRIGAESRTASMASGVRRAPEIITFTYTVRSGDPGDEGIGIPGDALRLNGGTIRDVVGNDADLSSSEVLPAVERAGLGAQIGCKQPPLSGRSGLAAARSSLQIASAGGESAAESPGFDVTLELDENRDGSRQPVALGCVAVAEPGRQFSYAIAAGDRSRFAVGAADGLLRYIGTGEELARTPEYLLTVIATPDDRGAAIDLSVRIVIVQIDDDGVVTLSTRQPLVGEAVTAALADHDGVQAGSAAWQWWRRKEPHGEWRAVAGATGSSYVPVPADGGQRLQARVGYRDGYGAQTAASAQTEAVDLHPARRERMLQVGLAGLGRTVAATAVGVIGERFSAVMRAAGDPDAIDLNLTLNGRPLALPVTGGVAARGAALIGAAEALGVRVQADGSVGVDVPSVPQILANSAFSARHGAPAARWGIWGGGDLSRFSADVDGFEQDATVLSGYLGADYRFAPNALAGLAASYSDLELTSVSSGDGEATLDGALVHVYPYGLWMPERWLGIWSLAGFGVGTVDLTDAGGTMRGEVRSWLGAAGSRTELWSAGALSLATKSDGFVTGLTTGGRLPVVTAHAWRARVLVEAGLAWRTVDSRIDGLVELGGRLDGGDAERGLGAEVGAELSYAHTGIGLGLAGRGRLLLVHEDRDLRDWGAGVTLTWEPPDRGPGLALAVAPTWGTPAGGANALWRDGEAALAAGGADASASASNPARWLPNAVDLKAAYGVLLPHGQGRLAPFAELVVQDAVAHRIRSGVTLDISGPAPNHELAIEAYGERTLGHGSTPSLQFGFGGSLEY